MAENRRNKSVAVADSILKSIESLRKAGNEPTFNAILARLRSRNILSNHRSLRSYLDIMIKSGLLSVRVERVKQPNVRAKQVFSLTGHGPFIEVGEKAMLFHGLNWIIPSRSSFKAESDIEGLVRARLAEGTVYGSLEDAVTGTLTRAKKTMQIYQVLTFAAALLATRKLDQEYLQWRSRQKHVEGLVGGLLGEIEYLMFSAKPDVDDVRTLYEIRKQLANRPRVRFDHEAPSFPLALDEMVDIIGKQLGVK